jgi:membrane-bound ClpP family serine protease
LKGEVDDGSVDEVIKDLQSAEDSGSHLVVLKIDTPGGYIDPTRRLVQAILDSPVPVVGYVAPAGAHAGSAGTFILSACHIAAMSPATNVGSAKPVMMAFGEPDPDMKVKIINDAAAQMRSLAQLRSRNAEWLESAVLESKNVTAQEALALGVIDLIAPSQGELLKQLDGREIDVAGQSVVLDLNQPEMVEGEASAGQPQYLWWVYAGLALLVFEVIAPGFIAMFFGAGALVTALAIYLGFPTEQGYQFGLFSVVSLALLFFFRWRFKAIFTGDATSAQGASELEAGMIGHRVDYVSGFDDASKGRGVVEYRGSNWQATGAFEVLAPGQTLVICGINSNVLEVEVK